MSQAMQSNSEADRKEMFWINHLCEA